MKKKFIKRLILLFLLISLLINCSTQKQIVKNTEFKESNLSWERKDFKNLTFKASAEATINDRTVNLKIKGKSAGNDSSFFSITGPFGISIGKAFISKNEFLFFDAYNNRYFSNKDNFGEINPQISFYIETLSHINKFIRNEFEKIASPIKKSETESNIEFFVTKEINDFYVIFNKVLSLIEQIKVYSNKNLEFIVNYSDFKFFDGIMFPEVMTIELMKFHSKIEISFDDLKFEEDFSKTPFKFNIPSGAERIK